MQNPTEYERLLDLIFGGRATELREKAAERGIDPERVDAVVAEYHVRRRDGRLVP